MQFCTYLPFSGSYYRTFGYTYWEDITVLVDWCIALIVPVVPYLVLPTGVLVRGITWFLLPVLPVTLPHPLPRQGGEGRDCPVWFRIMAVITNLPCGFLLVPLLPQHLLPRCFPFCLPCIMPWFCRSDSIVPSKLCAAWIFACRVFWFFCTFQFPSVLCLGFSFVGLLLLPPRHCHLAPNYWFFLPMPFSHTGICAL